MVNKRGDEFMSPKTQTVSLKELVYQGIIEQICSGNLTPDMVITEGQLIDTYGVSKSPIREALIQLCAEGVLKSMPRYGYQIIEVSQKTVHDLTELRLFLELGCLPRSLERMTGEQLLEFQRQNERRHQSPEPKTVWTAWNNNRDFHLQLVACAGNDQITNVLERALVTLRRAYAQAFINHRESVAPIYAISQHDIIVAALEKKDLPTIHEALKKDILQLEYSLLNLPH